MSLTPRQDLRREAERLGFNPKGVSTRDLRKALNQFKDDELNFQNRVLLAQEDKLIPEPPPAPEIDKTSVVHPPAPPFHRKDPAVNRPNNSSGGSNTPFQVVIQSATNYSITHGSILNGTNGTIEDLSAIVSVAGVAPILHTIGTGYVILEADVDGTTLAVTSWIVSISSDTDEVVFDAATPPLQNKIRLVLAEIVAVTGGHTAKQAVFTSQILSHGFLNGVIVKVLAATPTHF